MSKVIKGSRRPSASSASTPGFVPQPRHPTRKPIIEREEVDARAKAEQIIKEAQTQAEKILEKAQTDAETMRTQGVEEGREEGRAEYTKELTGALFKLEQMAQKIEPAYIRLVRSCVEKILGQELMLSPDAVVGIVRSALEDARQQREIIVRVNPNDVEALDEHRPRLLEKLARATNLELREDEAVASGGCLVVTELGTIDSTLERQLDAIESALLSELGDVPDEEP